MERKSVRRTVYFGERLNASVEEMLDSREMDFGTMVRQLLEQELERWKRANIQLTPKARPTGGAVGRPAFSPQEKQFREQVRYIDEVYFDLKNHFREDFERILGRQFLLYQQAKEARDYDTVNWWSENVPWQRRYGSEFEQLWNSRTKAVVQEEPATEDETHHEAS